MSLSTIKAFDPTATATAPRFAATAETAIPSAPVVPVPPAPGTPTPLTLEQVFGIKSQMPVLGFTPGHPLVPAKNHLYVWDSSRVKDIMAWLAVDSPDPLWISGPTGSGKTEMVVQIAAGLNAPFVMLTGRRDAEPADILGKTHFVDGSTKFVPGVVLDVYANGGVICIDEIESFPPEVGLSLHRMFERKPLFLEDGTIVNPAARVLILATGNTRGDGEGGDAYTGTSIFNLATLNRFEKWLVNYPSAEVEENILLAHLPKLKMPTVQAMVKSAADIRVSYQQGSCPGPISIRDLIRWGTKIILSESRTDVLPVFHAFDLAFGNGVDRHVRGHLHKLVQTHFGVEAPKAPEY